MRFEKVKGKGSYGDRRAGQTTNLTFSDCPGCSHELHAFVASQMEERDGDKVKMGAGSAEQMKE